MKNKKPKLPRGLRWDPKSPFIFFSWRDERGKLHQKSTEKADPAEALLFKIRFLQEQKDKEDAEEPELAELGNLPLKEASERYFSWKMANNGAATCRGPAIVGHEGFLNLEDIYNLNLPVDLVVLSACETGLGKAIRGEGLLGLTPGSMHAGTAGTYSLQFTAGADPASHAVNFGVQ